MDDTQGADAEHDGAEPARRRRRIAAPLVFALAVVAVVGVIAATGGLRAVATPGPSDVGLGEPLVSARTTLTLDRVAVMDELWGSGAFPDDAKGERVLAVVVDVVNLDDEPRNSSETGSLSDIRLESRPDDQPNVSVYGDDDFSVVTLQPDVPVMVLLAWVVDEHEVGDEVRLVIPDAVKSDSTLFSGESIWSAVDPLAVVTARPEDLGAGSQDGTL